MAVFPTFVFLVFIGTARAEAESGSASTDSTRSTYLRGLFDYDSGSTATNPFVAVDEIVVMEMESAPIQGDWVLEDVVPDYTGKGYYRMNGNTIKSGPPNGPLSFYFQVSKPGMYRLNLRSYKDNQDDTWSNDVYTHVEGLHGYTGNATKTFMSGPSFEWSWITRLEIKHGVYVDEPMYDLQSGSVHRLEVAGRSKNFNIDRIVLRHLNSTLESDALDLTRPQSPQLSGAAISSPAATTMPQPAPKGSDYSLTFSLLDAETGIPIVEDLKDGSIVTLGKNGVGINIRANVVDAVDGIQFGWMEKPSFRVDQMPPYSLFGDPGGVYNTRHLSTGVYSFTGTILNSHPTVSKSISFTLEHAL